MNFGAHYEDSESLSENQISLSSDEVIEEQDISMSDDYQNVAHSNIKEKLSKTK